MPKPKDAKVWNEDLINALEARHQLALREGKRDAHSWRVGCEKMQAVRKDIYQFRTGTIVNMPRLAKRVERLCEDIIRGVKNVYPDGHVPTNANAKTNANTNAGYEYGYGYEHSYNTPTSDAGKGRYGGRFSMEALHATPSSVASSTATPKRSGALRDSAAANHNGGVGVGVGDNPFLNYHYTKTIKIRGGAFAILMAFHYSQSSVLRKSQICREGQKFCDDAMDANFHAGRTYGAWSSIKTLKDKHFVKEQGFAAYSPRGFRDRPHEYSLTTDGELFVRALLETRPEAAEAARQAAGGVAVIAGRTGSYGGGGGGGGGGRVSSAAAAAAAAASRWSLSSPLAAIGTGGSAGLKNADRIELEEWIASASTSVGDRKEFRVGKDRRKHLHDLCDALQNERPGLLLTHGSSGAARGRTLSIQLISKPHETSSSTIIPSVPMAMPMAMPAHARSANPFSPETDAIGSSGVFPGIGRSAATAAATTPSLSNPSVARSARQNAALAAIKREEEARADIDLKKAIAESMKLAAKTKTTTTPNANAKKPQPMQTKSLFDVGNAGALFHNNNNNNNNSGGGGGGGDFDTDDDPELKQAIEASLQESKKSGAVKRNLFSDGNLADSDGGGSDDDDVDDEALRRSVLSMSPPKKRRRKTNSHYSPGDDNDTKPAANEILCIYSDSDSYNNGDGDGDADKNYSSEKSSTGRGKNSRMQTKKPRAVTSDELSARVTTTATTTGPSIDLCHSDYEEHETGQHRKRSRNRNKNKITPVDVEESNNDDEPIDLSNSQIIDDGSEEHKHEPIDLSNSQKIKDDAIDPKKDRSIDIYDSQIMNDDDDDEIIIVDDTTTPLSSGTPVSKSDHELTVLIDNRERNRNATPRTLRMELTRHLASGSLRDVWPSSLPPARVEEEGLEWGDIQYVYRQRHRHRIGTQTTGNSNSNTEQPQRRRRRFGVSVERKRVNDLVQRSADGDHLTQLFRMRQHCSLSVLLIETDTRTAAGVTPYNAQNHRERFDPLDSTITCESDAFRLFGRLLLSCNSNSNYNDIKFIQTRDEQASLRAIGALGLMTVVAPAKYTTEIDAKCPVGAGATATINGSNHNHSNSNSDGVQSLCDQLMQGGIPWRLAKRVAKAVGSFGQLVSLYDSCCSEKAKSNLLTNIIATGSDQDQGDLKSSAIGWSDAIYRIVTFPQPLSDEKLPGQAALLLHKELVEDHGVYLSTLYQGHSHETTLERVLDNPSATSTPTSVHTPRRHVAIRLTDEQATKYFNPRPDDERAFYKLSIVSESESRCCHSGAITMRAVCDSFASEALSIFEMEGSDVVELVRDNWSSTKQKQQQGKQDFVSLAKTVARLVDTIVCHGKGRSTTTKSKSNNNNGKRIILVCGLQPALDANARRSGYATETKTVVDLVFAELLLCYDVSIIQALRKKMEDRVDVVQQLALACFHHGFLVRDNTEDNE